MFQTGTYGAIMELIPAWGGIDVYTYGRKWQQALEKILKRLAYREGPGFLVVEGPDASGKTDLIDLVSNIAKGSPTDYTFHNQTMKKLKADVHLQNYFQVRIDYAGEMNSIPLVLFMKLEKAIHMHGLQQGQRVLILWDDFELSFMNTPHHEENRGFIEELLEPPSLFDDVTIICTVMAPPGEAYNLLGITTDGFDHFLQL